MKIITLLDLYEDFKSPHYNLSIPSMDIDELIYVLSEKGVYITETFIVYRYTDGKIYLEEYNTFEKRVVKSINETFSEEIGLYFDEPFEEIDSDKLTVCSYNSNYIFEDIVKNYFKYYLNL